MKREEYQSRVEFIGEGLAMAALATGAPVRELAREAMKWGTIPTEEGVIAHTSQVAYKSGDKFQYARDAYWADVIKAAVLAADWLILD